MDTNFWHSRWSEGRIGFHEGKSNALLEKHRATLGTGRRVLVPLCGKAEDLAYLAAQGHQVVGVEWVESAVRAFFEEHQVKPEVTKEGAFTRYTAQNITVLAGDFFATTRKLLGPVEALYDRAALIALPETMRGGYVKHVRALMPVGASGLIITVEYPQEKMNGPPFSVVEAELRTHCEGLLVELVETARAEGPRFTPIEAIEKCFVVRF